METQITQTKHTFGILTHDDTYNNTMIFDKESGNIIAITPKEGYGNIIQSEQERIANAQHIIKAVNMHDKLTDALQMICNYASQKKFDINVLKQMAEQGKELIEQSEQK